MENTSESLSLVSKGLLRGPSARLDEIYKILGFLNVDVEKLFQMEWQTALQRQSMITAMVFIDQPEVDVHVQDVTQTSALHTWAEMSSTPAAAAILNKSSAIIALQDQYSKTPLHYAAEQRSKLTTSLLLNHGADANAQNAAGSTALHMAIIKRDALICGILPCCRDTNWTWSLTHESSEGLEATSAGCDFRYHHSL
ncbi:ankyrin repeat protein [Metarhizium robertsii]|uniref:Ankyrin repeat protein n=1 Tax=Metarhizium robertsii TaxID=568076 RepID=A0A014NBF6_9HYPO|nr:ankyrin repeat protein [Metarhizium robertsii]